MQTLDKRRARGDESRRAVLAKAVDLASVNGLDGLSIGGLASEVSASKSGVAALFGTKEQLQLAVIQTARDIVIASVIAPARQQPRGIRRVCALLDGWLEYSQNRVFEGGCFFLATAAEYDSKPGPVRDAIALAVAERQSYIAQCLAQAVELGELAAAFDSRQLAFEITALYDAANAASLLQDSDEPYAFARRGIASRLSSAGADHAVLVESGLVA